MKSITLKRSTISIPESWDDVRPDHIPAVFRNLILLFSNEITPFQFQINLLILFTGYRPTKKRGILFCTKRLFYLTFYRIFKGKRRFIEMLNQENEIDENIQFNLIQLAETITFAFTLDGKKIIPNYDFNHNPLSGWIDAPTFDRDVTVETNITARQFIDCVDLLNAYRQSEDPKVQTFCLNKIMCVLYGLSMPRVKTYNPEIPFGVMYWFTGIVMFFREHPVYSVLYESSKTEEDDDDSKINLGMSEILLYLEKEGYSFVEDKNVIDFFNAQVKGLKDSINTALSSGLKIEELATQTGISINTIDRLSN